MELKYLINLALAKNKLQPANRRLKQRKIFLKYCKTDRKQEYLV